MEEILGKGGFGTVVLRNGEAVKTFKNLRHLIHEYAAALYLKKCPYIVNVYSANFDTLEMNMKLYTGSVNKWLKKKRTEKQKMHVLQQTLKGLTYLYDLGLVHGDIKPGNTLVNWDQNGNVTELVLGDVGFLAIQRYGKVRGTTPTYQEPHTIKSDYRHDIYSLGVFVTEMFMDLKFTKEDSYDTKMHYAKEISNRHVRSWTIKMLDYDRNDRPTPRKILKSLFGEKPVVQPRLVPQTLNFSLTEKDISSIQKIFIKWSEVQKTKTKEYKKINRTKIAFHATIEYIQTFQILSSQYKVCSYAMLVIFSSIFGDLKMSVEAAANHCGVSNGVMQRYVMRLLTNENVLKRIFYCKEKHSLD